MVKFEKTGQSLEE